MMVAASWAWPGLFPLEPAGGTLAALGPLEPAGTPGGTPALELQVRGTPVAVFVASGGQTGRHQFWSVGSVAGCSCYSSCKQKPEGCKL